MRRRDFIKVIAGSAAAWPLAARAQQWQMPVVGFLGTTTPDDFADRVAAFRGGLMDFGYVEGQNVVIEYRWPEGNYDPLATLAADLVRRQGAVIAAVGGEPSALAAKAATATMADDFDPAFAALAQQKVDALLLANDALSTGERRKLIALAARYAIPAVYFWREFAVDGGLMSYSSSLAQAYRQVGIYTGKILNGAKPADLPVIQPTKFEFVINLKTAKTLGLTFPPGLLAIADEVIE